MVNKNNKTSGIFGLILSYMDEPKCGAWFWSDPGHSCGLSDRIFSQEQKKGERQILSNAAAAKNLNQQSEIHHAAAQAADLFHAREERAEQSPFISAWILYRSQTFRV